MKRKIRDYNQDGSDRRNSNRLILGAIEWFDNYKGFGLLQSSNNGSVLVHIQNFAKKPKDKLKKHQLVAFRLMESRDNPEKHWATGSFLIEAPSHFKILMSLLGQDSTVMVRDNPLCLLQRGTQQIFETRTRQSFTDTVINYYESNLDDVLFIEFCKYLEMIAIPVLKEPNPDLLEQQFYCHFYRNLRPSILFQAWKYSAFRYIGYTDGMEYEIPAEVIEEYSHLMDMSDWKRIGDYSYANSFFKK